VIGMPILTYYPLLIRFGNDLRNFRVARNWREKSIDFNFAHALSEQFLCLGRQVLIAKKYDAVLKQKFSAFGDFFIARVPNFYSVDKTSDRLASGCGADAHIGFSQVIVTINMR